MGRKLPNNKTVRIHAGGRIKISLKQEGLFYQKAKLIVFIVVLIFLLFPYQAFADTWEYYTYGGYNAVVDAWKRVGLIFSDNTFKGLYFSVILLGVIILYFMVLARATLAGQARFNLAGWAVPVLLGASIYIAFIVPKDRIVVYDTVLNRGPETISNIPKIMAMTAGLLNKIEKGMIDIVRVSSTPVEDYAQNAGGTGFVILSQFGDPATISLAGVPMYVHQTAYQFIKDCLVFELGREGTLLTAQDINSGKIDFATAIQRAENPGVPTVYYDTDGKEVSTIDGSEVTCQAAGEILKSYILYNKDAVIASTCAMSGYNVDVPQELNACKNLVESTFRDGLAGATGRSGNLDLLAAQAFFAYSLINTLNSINPESSIKLMATKEAASQYLGLAIHANTWLPVIKEALRTVSIAISPFVLLFAATPLVGRALGFLVGMMVWVVTWSVIDAILHYAAVSQAVAASKEFTNVITNGTPGTMFFVLLPSYSSKVAAVFGAIRWSGLGLATVLTGMLIKFGGAALAMVAGSITGAAQSAGAAMGRMVADVTSPIRADLMPTASWTNAMAAAGGITSFTMGMIESQVGNLLGEAQSGSYLGAGEIAKAGAFSRIESVKRYSALGSSTIAAAAGTIAGLKTLGEVTQTLDYMKKNPNLPIQLGALAASKNVQEYLALLAQANKHGIPLDQLIHNKYLGYDYRDQLFKGMFADILIQNGKAIPVNIHDWGVFAASLKQAETKSLENIFTRSFEAVNSISFEDMEAFYKDIKHLLSQDLQKKFDTFFNNLRGRSVRTSNKSESSDGETYRTATQLFAELTAELSGKLKMGQDTIISAILSIPGVGGVLGQILKKATQGAEGAFGGKGTAGVRVTQTEEKFSGFSNTNSGEISKETLLKTLLGLALTTAVVNSDSKTIGNLFQKRFLNSHKYQELVKSVENYKELHNFENSMTLNTLLMMTKFIGDTIYSYLPDSGPLNKYDMALSVMAQDFLSGKNIDLYKQVADLVVNNQKILEAPQGSDLINYVGGQLINTKELIEKLRQRMPHVNVNINPQKNYIEFEKFLDSIPGLSPNLKNVLLNLYNSYTTLFQPTPTGNSPSSGPTQSSPEHTAKAPQQTPQAGPPTNANTRAPTSKTTKK